MKSFIKKNIGRFGRFVFYNAFSEFAENMCNTQEVQVLLQQQYKEVLARKIRPLPTFDEVGFRRHSQFEEDGILLYLFAMIGTTNKIAVEICAGNGIQCNTANLIVNHGWNGFLFDGGSDNVEAGKAYFASHKNTFLWPPTFTQTWITAENVNEVVQKVGVYGEIDLLSLDIDGVDYWVWKAIDCIQPRVVVCETQNAIVADKALTVPYDASFSMEIPDHCSASLAAMSKLASEKGYRLIGAHRYGFNAFFMRNDIAKDLFPAVPVAACLQHSYSKHAQEVRWPKVKDLSWVDV